MTLSRRLKPAVRSTGMVIGFGLHDYTRNYNCVMIPDVVTIERSLVSLLFRVRSASTHLNGLMWLVTCSTHLELSWTLPRYIQPDSTVSEQFQTVALRNAVLKKPQTAYPLTETMMKHNQFPL